MPRRRRDPQSSYFRQNLSPLSRRPGKPKLKDLAEKCKFCREEIIHDEAVHVGDDLAHPECRDNELKRIQRIKDADPGLWEDLL